jgi:hypothetical protein
LENLKYDVSNGGLEDDTFAMNCYITMAKKARRLLRSGTPDQQAAENAKEFLALCCEHGSGGLRCTAEG